MTGQLGRPGAGIILAMIGVGITTAASLSAIITGIIFLTAGFFIAHSLASTLVGKLANGSKGHASSLYLLAYYMGSSVAGSTGGHFWSSGGWTGVALFSISLLAAALFAAGCAIRLERRVS